MSLKFSRDLYNVSARDLLVSRANQIHPAIFLDPKTAEGQFTISFLMSCSEEDLLKIYEAVNEKKESKVEINFCRKKDETSCATFFSGKDFETNDPKAKIASVSGKTCPQTDGTYIWYYIIVEFAQV